MCERICAKFAKTLLICFNILWFILGCAILGIGIWISVEKESLLKLIFPEEGLPAILATDKQQANANKLEKERNDAESNVDSFVNIASYAMIGVGGLIMMLALFGICGAVKESKCLLITYSSVLVLITIIQAHQLTIIM